MRLIYNKNTLTAGVMNVINQKHTKSIKPTLKAWIIAQHNNKLVSKNGQKRGKKLGAFYLSIVMMRRHISVLLQNQNLGRDDGVP